MLSWDDYNEETTTAAPPPAPSAMPGAATFLIPAMRTKPLTTPATALTWSGGAMVVVCACARFCGPAARVLTEAAPSVVSRRERCVTCARFCSLSLKLLLSRRATTSARSPVWTK